MRTQTTILTIGLILTIVFNSFSQEFTQIVRGKVIDKQSQAPIEFASITVLNVDPAIGTITNVDGEFKLEKVPFGRITIEISSLGYMSARLGNLEVNGSKELIVNVDLMESIEKLNEVVIDGSREKAKAINKMATVSARTFTIEESQRYAGSDGDVSRMAMNFAGVRGANDAVNDIVIRGNSPYGLLWRMEEVDIPNPNHFGVSGGTGGPVSMLNSNVLSNSDFMTSAFPAGYGNALSGVFDLKLKNGNNENHEFTGQVGFMGVELGAEGPISRQKRSSYIMYYRYSTLSLFQKMGMDLGTGTAVPEYDDLTVKLNFPSNKIGNISIFALAGRSNIDFLDSERDTTEEMPEDFYKSYEADMHNSNYSGVAGITHTYFFDRNTYSKVILSSSQIRNKNSADSLSTDTREIIPWYRMNMSRVKYTGNLYLNRKISVKNTVRTGIVIENIYDKGVDSMYIFSDDAFETLRDFDGNTWQYQPYVQWQHRVNDNITINTGLHSLYVGLTEKYSIEPRLGLSWKIKPKHRISIGYGIHSQVAPVFVYYRQVTDTDGSVSQPNLDLDLTKSHHFVVGYDWNLTETIRLKSEVYYQYVFDAITEEAPGYYSMLNSASMDGNIPEILANKGAGENYGMEITLEKFMDKGLYFLTTVSIFESLYKGSDNIERKTTFSGGYVVNFLGGKEFALNKNKVNPKKKKYFVLDGKLNMAGGQRIVPINLEQSISNGYTTYREHEAYEQQLDDYMKIDIRLAYKTAGKRITQEIALDIRNLTNRKNPLNQAYNVGKQEIQTIYQLGMLPLLHYKIMF